MQPTSSPTTTAQDFLSDDASVKYSGRIMTTSVLDEYSHDGTTESLAQNDGGEDAEPQANELSRAPRQRVRSVDGGAESEEAFFWSRSTCA